MGQFKILVTILCQSIFSNFRSSFGQRDTAQGRNVVEHTTRNHVILSIPRTIIALDSGYTGAVDIPLVVAVATLHNAGIGQIEHLNVRHRTMQVVDVRAVQWSCDGQRQYVVGIADGLNFFLQLSTSSRRNNKFGRLSDGHDMIRFRVITIAIGVHKVWIYVEHDVSTKIMVCFERIVSTRKHYLTQVFVIVAKQVAISRERQQFFATNQLSQG